VPKSAVPTRNPFLLATACALAAAVAAAPARAQQIPGVSVVLPPSASKPSAVEGVPPAAAPAAPAAKPKPAPKPAAAKASPPKTAAVKNPSEDGPAMRGGSGQAIVALVNDEPITAYEVEQRQRFMGMSADIKDRVQDNFKRLIQNPQTTERLKEILNETINANKGKTKDQIVAIFEERKKQFALTLQKQAIENARATVLPGLKKQALEELIEERLKLQEAKRIGVNVTDDDADRMIKNIADRNKMTVEQFGNHLKGMGADINSMRGRFKASLAWQDVIRRKFGHQIAITEKDIDRVIANAPSGGEDGVELQVQRILVPMPGKIDQKLVAQRLGEAEAARKRFTDCKSGPAAAASVPGARFEDLGTRKPASIPEPTRSLLLNARDGEVLPPSVGDGGVELWAVCSRKTVKADEQKRNEAGDQLRQKEFELLAKRHLKDLRQDAHIEYR
jgi:peptidyl-prolyl cis-trans isomerase SurA